jgi:hypothetical protein
MTAEVIPFPKSKKQLELEAMKNYVDNAKLIIAKNIADDLKNYNGPNIRGVPVEEPKTRSDFLELCKQFLDPEDYQDILCGIMDREHYDALETELCNVIDSYFSFKK